MVRQHHTKEEEQTSHLRCHLAENRSCKDNLPARRRPIKTLRHYATRQYWDHEDMYPVMIITTTRAGYDDLGARAAMKLLEGGGRRDQHLLMGFYACYATACMQRGLSSLQTSSLSSSSAFSDKMYSLLVSVYYKINHHINLIKRQKLKSFYQHFISFQFELLRACCWIVI